MYVKIFNPKHESREASCGPISKGVLWIRTSHAADVADAREYSGGEGRREGG